MTSCIIVQIKNENIYLDEWITYHKNLGINHIYVIDNNDIDGEDPNIVLSKYGDFISYENKRGINEPGTHKKSYVDTYNINSNNYDWFIFIDVDEFITLNNYENINDYLSLECFHNVDQILINWVVYTDNNLIHYENRPVIERFIERYNGENADYNLNLMFKPILHGGLHIKNWDDHKYHNVVNFENPFKTVNESGKLADDYYGLNRQHYESECYIRHYMTKSLEEFLIKKYNKDDGDHNYQYDIANAYLKINTWNNDKEIFFNSFINHDLIKYSIVTCLFGNYDILKEPKEIDKNAEYICITDRKDLTSNTWKIIYDEELDNDELLGIQKSFIVKYLKLFDYVSKDSKYIIRLDASIQIHKSLYDIIKYIDDNNFDCALMMHPERNNLIDEYNVWESLRNHNPYFKEKFLQKMNDNYFNEFNKGLIETTLQIYKNNDICKKLFYSLSKCMKTVNFCDNNDQCYYTYVMKDFVNKLNILFINRQIISSKYMDLCFHYTNEVVYKDHNHARGPLGEFIYDLDKPIYYTLYNKTKKIHYFI